jgi:rSAM/selenodomain-associated transferase 2
MTPAISIIMPALNETDSIEHTLVSIRALNLGAEVIVIDGGSTDNTRELAKPLAHQLLHTDRGRARQMNAGAQAASGDYLLFLHADTELTPQAATQLQRTLEHKPIWGRFDVRISGDHHMLAIIAFMMNWRSRLTGIATGDQAIFLRREVFESMGGFADQPLMEDIELSRKLLKRSRPVCLKGPVITSGRRWQQHGVWATIVLMWRLRWRYWRGASAEQLAREYRR